jgi:SAM-dependent methyltransferase
MKVNLMMDPTPIALFTYNRLFHTQQTVQSLLNNQLAGESDLYIFSDGPKNSVAEESVSAVRRWLKQIKGFKSVTIIEREHNLGLAQSIIQGVTECINRYGRLIVLEDDLVVSPYFLKYMNDGLNLYEQDEQVASIVGYTYPSKTPLPETYFCRGTDCWGWATWKRAWDLFGSDGKILLQALQRKKLLKAFDYQGVQPNVQMLKDQIAGKNNSWAIRWHASAYVQNMLSLYPKKSLVKNIGFDNSGEHCGSSSMFNAELSMEPINVDRIECEENKLGIDACIQFLKQHRDPLHRKIRRKLSKLLSGAVGCRLKQRIIEFISKDYEKDQLINFVQKFAKPGARILDIGCGYGRLLRPLKNLGYEVTGIEQNEKIAENNRQNGFDCVLPVESQKITEPFELLIFSHVIEHFSPSDLLEFLNHYLSKLKQGGHVIIATPLYSNYFYDDFDHVKPYHPLGLQMVFGGENAQVQYYSPHRLTLKELWFRKSPYWTIFHRAKYFKSFKTRFLQMIDVSMMFLFRITGGLIGRKDGWIGVFEKTTGAD